MAKISKSFNSGKNLRYNEEENVWEKESISVSANDVYLQTDGTYAKYINTIIGNYEYYQKLAFIDILKKANITIPESSSWDDICETICDSQIILFSEFLFEMIGEEQEFVVPISGDYEIACYGAQGSNTNSYSGGLGGGIIASISLKASDKMRIVVGGQNGYSDGGTGTVSNGGGATWVYLNDELLFVAGGGGGACQDKNGSDGGNSDSSTLTTTSKGETSSEKYTFGGGGGYLGGKIGKPVYHVHSGNTSSGGACYATANRCGKTVRNKSQDVYRTCGGSCSLSGHKGNGLYTYKTCNSCGKTEQNTVDGYGFTYPVSACGNSIYDYTRTWRECDAGHGSGSESTCTKILSYSLSCKKTDTTIDSYTLSYGGSNYENDNLYTECSSYSGVNEGNGYVKIKYCR